MSAGCSSSLFTPTRKVTRQNLVSPRATGALKTQVRGAPATLPFTQNPAAGERQANPAWTDGTLDATVGEPRPRGERLGPWRGLASLPSASGPDATPGEEVTAPSEAQAASGRAPPLLLQLPPGQRRGRRLGSPGAGAALRLGRRATSTDATAGDRVAEATFHVLIGHASPSLTQTFLSVMRQARKLCPVGGRNPKGWQAEHPGAEPAPAPKPRRDAQGETPPPRPQDGPPGSRGESPPALGRYGVFQRQPLNVSVFLPSVSQFASTPTPRAWLNQRGFSKAGAKGPSSAAALPNPAPPAPPRELPASLGGRRFKGEDPAEFRWCASRVHLFRPAALMNRWTETKPSASKATDAILKHDTPAGLGTPGVGLRCAGLTSSWRNRSPHSARPPRTPGAPPAPSCPGGGSTDHAAPSSNGRGAWHQKPRLPRGVPGNRGPQRAAVGHGCIRHLLESRRLQQGGAHGELWGVATRLGPAWGGPANQHVGCRLASFRSGEPSLLHGKKRERENVPLRRGHPDSRVTDAATQGHHAGRRGPAGTPRPLPRTAACPSEHRLCLNVRLPPGREHRKRGNARAEQRDEKRGSRHHRGQGVCGTQSGPEDLPESRSTLRGKRQTQVPTVLVTSSPEHTGHSPGWGCTAARLRVPGTVRAGSSPAPREQGTLLTQLP